MERPPFHYYLNYTYNYVILYCCVSYSLNISEKGDFGLKCMPEVDDTQFESLTAGARGISQSDSRI